MREYVSRGVLLLAAFCYVSPFRIYLPEHLKRDGEDKEVSHVVDQLTEICIGVCLNTKLDDVSDCRSWCRDLLSPAKDPNLTSSDEAPDLRPSPPPPRHRLAHRNDKKDDKDEDNGQEHQQWPERARKPLDDVPGSPSGDFWNQIRRVLGLHNVISGDGTTAKMAAKRQVDPLLSCIEARCAGVRRISYGNCIYSKCLAGWKRKRGSTRVFGRRYVEERDRGSDDEVKRDRGLGEEGWKVKRQGYQRRSGNVVDKGIMRRGFKNGEEGWKERVVVGDDRGKGYRVKTIRGTSTGLEEFGGDEPRGREEHWDTATSLHYHPHQLESTPEFNNYKTSRYNQINNYRNRNDYKDNNYSEENTNNRKRSWNDVMQTCIEYKCSHTAPGTFDYNVCIQQACSKHMFGKR